MDRLLNVKEAAKLLSMNPGTLYLWAGKKDEEGKSFIPHFRIGRTVRFRERDLVKWVRKMKVPARDK